MSDEYLHNGDADVDGRDGLAILLHDVRNYIQIATSAVSIMSRHADVIASEGLGSMVSNASASLERASALIRRSSLEDDARADELVSVDATINQMASMLRYACGPQIRIRLRLGLLPRIRCNRLAFQTAVLNLALNARDAMPDGGTLTVSALLADGPETAEIEITVVDTGAGMSAEVVARAFDPHFTTKQAGAGHGMGLSGVKAFVGQCGGRAFIRSSDGGGTSVVLRLPVTPYPTGAAP